jgi:hypothetical protein
LRRGTTARHAMRSERPTRARLAATMAAKKSSKKKSARKKAEPSKAARKKSPPRKAARSTAKASTKPAAKASKAKAASAKPKAKPKKAATARAKSAPPKKASVRPRSASNGVHRRDRAGHLDPKYAADLRAKSKEGREASNDSAFLRGSKSSDDLAEELGEEAVETMTSGEDEGSESRDRFAEEEIGGPFVESPGKNEFADDSDESNPDDATREPFPKT